MNISKTMQTDSGHVVKNVDRINNLRVEMEIRQQWSLKTWQISRWIRRDFNLTSTYMYFKFKEKGMLENVLAILSEIESNEKILAVEAGRYELDFNMEHSKVELRIINRESMKLINLLLRADTSIARLNCALALGQLNVEDLGRMIEPLFRSLSDLKVYVSTTKRKTSAQIAHEMGIA